MEENILSVVEEKLIGMLKENKVGFRLLEHEPVYTSEQAARVRGVPVRTGVKALVLKTYEGRFVLALVRADKRADLEAIAEREGTRNVRLARPEQVLELCGCEIGSVPPFGHLTKLRTYMDREILDEDEVNFNIGSHTRSVRMKAQDLLKVISPILI